MKKTILWLLIPMLLLAPGCASLAKSTGEDPVPAAQTVPDDRPDDGAFIEAVSGALEARWSVAAEYSEQELTAMSLGEYQDYLHRCVDAERTAAGHLWDFNFHDSDLITVAQTYYHGLELQREGADYARTENLAEYERTWVLGYYYRVSALYDLHSLYGLTVEEGYESALRELIAPYRTAKKHVALQEFANAAPGAVRYEPDGEGKYTALIENTTEYTILSMSVEASFYDSRGVIVYQTSDWISNLRPGETIRSTVAVDAEDVVDSSSTVTIYQ